MLNTVRVQYSGEYLDYLWRCSVLWGYHDKCGGYLEYHGVLMTVEIPEYHGGYIEYHGGYSVPWGYMVQMGGIS